MTVNDCAANYYATLPACTSSFIVKLPKDSPSGSGLAANTPYHYFIEDKFGHIYHKEVLTGDDAGFSVYAEDFPDGMFNPYNGYLIMEIKEAIGYCNPVSFIICGEAYDRIVIDFKKGDLPTQIPCTC